MARWVGGVVETFGANFEASDMLRMFPTFIRNAQVAPSIRRGIEDNVFSKLDEMSRDAGEVVPLAAYPQFFHG